MSEADINDENRNHVEPQQVTPVELNAGPINPEYRLIAGMLLQNKNLTTENAEQSEALEHARIDSLTGLPDKKAFDEEFSAIVERHNEEGNVALLIFDADGLKRLNDLVSRSAGDDLIRTMAESVQFNSRPFDRLYRIGGDEVALVIINGEVPKDEAGRREITNSYTLAVNHDIQTSPNLPPEQHPGASVGIAVVGKDDTYQDVINRAFLDMIGNKQERKAALDTAYLSDDRLLPSGL
jgi:diguanylate cyclase (GGDEF)-like protein